MNKSCETCRYCEMEEGYGLCHRYPPKMLGAVQDNLPWSEFPNVSLTEWCGEYAPRKGKS